MATYRRNPFYFIDNRFLSISLLFYKYSEGWGFRRLAWLPKSCKVSCDRWSIDTPWFSLFIELWFLARL